MNIVSENVNAARRELLLLQSACEYEAGQRKTEANWLVIVEPQKKCNYFWHFADRWISKLQNDSVVIFSCGRRRWILFWLNLEAINNETIQPANQHKPSRQSSSTTVISSLAFVLIKNKFDPASVSCQAQFFPQLERISNNGRCGSHILYCNMETWCFSSVVLLHWSPWLP